MRNLPIVMGGYLLFDGGTGAPVAYVDRVAETFVKTAANSAAASEVLSNPDLSVLLMVGSGRLAHFLIKTHATTHPIKRVIIWNRTPSSADALACEGRSRCHGCR